MGIRTALATVPVIIALWLGIAAYLVQKYQANLDETSRDTRNFSHAFEENIRRTVEAIDTTIRAVRVARASDPVHFDIQAWERDSGLTRELTLQISFADRLGNVVTSNLGSTASPVSIADREHFRIPRDTPEDRLFISRPVLGRVSKRWSVQFVRKVYDTDGRFDGVIVASLDPAFLSRFSDSLHIGRGALLLIGEDGIVRSVAPSGLSALNADLSPTRLMAGIVADPQGTLETSGLADGLGRIFSWRRVDPYGLVVIVGLSTVDALTGYQRDLKVYVTSDRKRSAASRFPRATALPITSWWIQSLIHRRTKRATSRTSSTGSTRVCRAWQRAWATKRIRSRGCEQNWRRSRRRLTWHPAPETILPGCASHSPMRVN